MRYDVRAYDGRDSDRYHELRQVARSRIAKELRELERREGSLAFAIVTRPIVNGSSSSVTVGAAVRGGVGWSVRVSREG
jgi:hypothetical protein